MPPFKFHYNKLNTVAQLPNRLSNAQDHWGYYNGKSQNRCLIGYYENYGNVDCNPDFLADRSVDTDFNMAFMLDEVIFPTGGVTQYRYDRHSYGYVPGVRMKEIITRSENSKVSARKLYEYSGISLVGGGPLYVQSFPSANHLGPGNWPGTVGYVRAGLQMLSEPCGDMVVYIAFANIANFEGDLIGRHGFYESVVETQPGNGSIETYFSVDEVDNYMMGSDTYPLIFNKPALMLGKPVREVVKREDGVPVREVRYEYGYYHRKIVEEADAARLYASPCKQIIQYYPIYTGFSFLKKKEDIVYFKKANNDLTEKMVATTYDYGGIQEEYKNHQWAVNPGDYGEPLHHFVTEQAVGPVMDAYRLGRKKYAIDFSSDIEGSATSFDASSEAINELLDRGVTAAVVEEISTVSRDGAETVLGGKLNIYEKRTVDKGMGNTVELVSLKAVANLEPQTPLPYTAGSFSKIEGQNNTYLFNYNENYVIQSTVSEYDKWSNVLEYDEKGENKKAYLYGHQEFLPIIEAENTSSSDLRANVGLALEEMDYTNGLLDLDIFLASLGDLAAPSQKAAWSTFMERVRNKYASQAVLLNFYAYNEYGGASAIADYNTRNTYYEYDVHKRLVNVLDDKSNIRQNYQYHYLDPDRAFFNEVQSRTYQKNDCPNEATGSSVVYTVPAGRYTSPYSQEAANQLAIEDLDINGQAHANEHGTCTGGTVLYYNVYMSRTFTKECPSGQIGTEEEYEVHAGEYSSTVSQADANSKALNDINTNGQAYANSSGTCRIVTNLEWANYTSDGNNGITSIKFYNTQGTTLLHSFGSNNLDEYETNIIDRGIYKVVVEVQGEYYDQMNETGYLGIRMRLSTSSPFSYIDACQNHPGISNTTTYTFEQVDLTNRNLMVFQIEDNSCN